VLVPGTGVAWVSQLYAPVGPGAGVGAGVGAGAGASAQAQGE
jgi:hypothetical protein